MDPETRQALLALDAKVSAIWESVEKSRRYFQITLWVTVALLIFPLFAMLFVAPLAIGSYTSSLDPEALELLQGL